jgi:hypothetical protein
MTDDDPDGFDSARRREVMLRLAALPSIRHREELVATLTSLELAEYDLTAIIDFGLQYEASETSFPIPESNTRAMADPIAERQADIDRLRGTSGPEAD